MAIVTSTYLSNLEFGNRFDAELYNPNLLSSFNVLEKLRVDLKLLGELCSIRSGTTPPDRDDCLKVGPLLFKTTDVRNNIMSPFDEYYHISPSIHQRMSTTKIKPYDVLLNIVGATLDVIGRSAIVMNDINDANITQAMVFLRIKRGILPGFLFAYINTKYAQDQIKRYARPTGQFNLNLDEVGKIVIPCFDNSIQQEINELVLQSSFFQKQSKALYSQAEQKLAYALQLDQIQISRKKWYTAQYKDVVESNRLDSAHFKDIYASMLDFYKKKFECKRIGQFVSLNRRGVQPIYSNDGDIIVVNSKHLSNSHIKYDQTERTTLQEFEKQQVAQIRFGDVLIYTTGAYVGLTNAYNIYEKALASNHVNILRISDSSIDPNYLALVLNSKIGKLQTEKYSCGSAQLELYPTDIAKFVIPLIHEDEMKEIGKMVRDSLSALNQSKQLLAAAKFRIEEIIEQEAKKCSCKR